MRTLLNKSLLFLAALCLAAHARADGIITTVAGVGITSGIPANLAEISSPNGGVVDGVGNYYFADTGNNLVREVDASSGIITTIAGNGSAGFLGDGGPATAAELDGPEAVAFLPGGFLGSSFLYIADTNNHRIRRVDLGRGTIVTVAGSGATGTGNGGYAGDNGPAAAAILNEPWSVLVDASNNSVTVYVADTNNNRVRRFVDFSAGGSTMATVAGVGSAGYSGDGAPALAAQLDSPQGLALDPNTGDLYISDTHNEVVRRVSGAIISAVAGTHSAGDSGDGGPATAAEIDTPAGLCFDPKLSNLYIADSGNSRIRLVDMGGAKNITTVAGTPLSYGFGGDGGPATDAFFAQCQGVFLDSAGNLYIADTSNDRIRRVDSAGIVNTVAGNGLGDGGPANLANLSAPGLVALDRSGNLYVPDSGHDVIRKVNGATGLIQTVAGNGITDYTGDGGPATEASLNSPYAIVFDDSNNMFFCDTGNNCIREVAADGTMSTIAGDGNQGAIGDGGDATAAELSGPFGLALDAAHNLYIADTGNDAIRRVDGAGVITTVAGQLGFNGSGGDGGPAILAALSQPYGVAVDGAHLYIADSNNNAIRRVDLASGNITTVAGTGAFGFNGDGPALQSALAFPTGVTLDPAGHIFVADYGNARIRRIDPSTGLISTAAGSRFQGYAGDGGPATQAELFAPFGLALDSLGNFYIGDLNNNRVRKVTYTSAATAALAAAGKVVAYPSPSSGRVCFAFKCPAFGDLEIQVYNAALQLAATIREPGVSAGPQSVCEDLSRLPNGAYVYRLSVAGTGFPPAKFKVVK